MPSYIKDGEQPELSDISGGSINWNHFEKQLGSGTISSAALFIMANHYKITKCPAPAQ